MDELHKWKESENKKPLIICGSRQVGKTWLMESFAKDNFANHVYINLKNNPRMNELFSSNLSIEKIILNLNLYTGFKINPADTLLIFDEIQQVPQMIETLKQFYERFNKYYIICASAKKINTADFAKIIDLYPLSFKEFLYAKNEPDLAKKLENADLKELKSNKDDYIDLLKMYFYVGGMPEVVYNFVKNLDFNEVKDIQKRIITDIEQDISLNAPLDILPRLRLLWNCIPAQLLKQSKKFVYNLIKKGERSKDYEPALQWLSDFGFIEILHHYKNKKAFKIFIQDIGLLSCMMGLKQDILLDGNQLFNEFNQSLTEQYVLQQFKTVKNAKTYYWTNDRNSAEIEFLLEIGGNIIPVEVAPKVNQQAKSLKVYCEKFNPPTAIRVSLLDYKNEGDFVNLPLYALNAM
jgi:hypothetical protein